MWYYAHETLYQVRLYKAKGAITVCNFLLENSLWLKCKQGALHGHNYSTICRGNNYILGGLDVLVFQNFRAFLWLYKTEIPSTKGPKIVYSFLERCASYLIFYLSRTAFNFMLLLQCTLLRALIGHEMGGGMSIAINTMSDTRDAGYKFTGI